MESENYIESVGLSAEQNSNIIDAIHNKSELPVSPPVPIPEEKPLDKVKEPPRRKRSRDLVR